jgi:hypothetical protein
MFQGSAACLVTSETVIVLWMVCADDTRHPSHVLCRRLSAATRPTIHCPRSESAEGGSTVHQAQGLTPPCRQVWMRAVETASGAPAAPE